MPSLRRMTGKGKFVAVLVILLLVGGSAGAYYYLHRDNTVPDGNGGTINLNPPSEAEKNDTRQHEEASQDKSDGAASSSDSDGSKKQVTPIITSWGKVDAGHFGVNGFVQDVIENDGTCTLKLSRQGKTVTETKKSFANVNNTTCGSIEVPYTSVAKGTTWQATLSYESSTAKGSSSSVNIKIE